jgi:hypothetical protein
MEDPRPGIGFRETLHAEAGESMQIRLAWEVDDIDDFARTGEGTVVGDVSHTTVGENVLASGGSFVRNGREWRAELRLPTASVLLIRDQRRWGVVEARLLDSGGAELANARLTTLGRPAWATLHARGVGSLAEGVSAMTRFLRLVLSPTSRT